jgi:hypothetical protein
VGRSAFISPIDSGLSDQYNPLRFEKFIREKRGNNSVVECNLAKVEVAGSNPVSRSIFLFFSTPPNFQKLVSEGLDSFLAPEVFGFLGGIPKWLRERSAKPRFGGSNPPAASISFPSSSVGAPR